MRVSTVNTKLVSSDVSSSSGQDRVLLSVKMLHSNINPQTPFPVLYNSVKICFTCCHR